MQPLRIAVIGVGHLGQAHARILARMPDVRLVGVSDIWEPQARKVAAEHQTQAYTDYRELIGQVDAASIVVPTNMHFDVASRFLEAGVPLLIEKPIASTVEQADALVALAQRQGVVLQVGHIERFNPTFVELTSRPLQPKYIECHRFGQFTGRSNDIGVVLDLMIHDIDLVNSLDRSPLVSVDALGVSILGGHEDIVNARLTFASGCVANLNASRMSLQPRRSMSVWAAEGFAHLDFMTGQITRIEPGENLRKRGIDVLALDPAQRASIKDEMFRDHMQLASSTCKAEPDQLTQELQEFVRCIRSRSQPRVTGQHGRDAVAIAWRVLESVRNHRWTDRADGPKGPNHLPSPLDSWLSGERRPAA